MDTTAGMAFLATAENTPDISLANWARDDVAVAAPAGTHEIARKTIKVERICALLNPLILLHVVMLYLHTTILVIPLMLHGTGIPPVAPMSWAKRPRYYRDAAKPRVIHTAMCKEQKVHLI